MTIPIAIEGEVAATRLTEAIQERDRILVDMDVEAAKAFIAAHGGRVTKRKIDWVQVLHMVRIEVLTLPEAMRHESRVWLAQRGARSILTLPGNSPYVLMAMELAFPRDVTEAFATGVMAEHAGGAA